MMVASIRRLVTPFIVVVTLSIVVVTAAQDPARHRHHHHHQRQDHPGRVSSHDYTSRQLHVAGYNYRCDDVCELQKSVQRLAASQLDYGRALHAVYGLVDAVRRDLAAVRSKGHVSRRNEVGGVYVNRTLSRPKRRMDRGVRRRSCYKSVQNLTSVVEQYSTQLNGLERRYKLTQSALNDVTNRVVKTSAAVESSDRQCVSLVEQIVAKQTNINANLLRKVAMLEKMLHTKLIQQQQQQHWWRSNVGLQDRQRVQNDAQQPTGSCPPGYVRHASSCYLFANESKTWIEAEKHCQTTHHDSHLISIETTAEMQAIVDYRTHNAAHWSSRYIWTGANDMASENRWTWVGTGREVGADGGYVAWRPGQPDNRHGDQHCMYADAGDSGRRHDKSVRRRRRRSPAGGWNDWHCYAARLNFVCEIIIKP